MILSTLSLKKAVPYLSFYLSSGILFAVFLNQETLPLYVWNNYLEREVNPPLYPDETIEALYQLMQGGILKDKRVAIWMPDSDAHDDAFALKLAYTYFSPLSTKIEEIDHADKAHGFDYVISPWEEYSLVSNGARIIHDEHWLFVYQISKSTEK
jgi:hypothetical protein